MRSDGGCLRVFMGRSRLPFTNRQFSFGLNSQRQAVSHYYFAVIAFLYIKLIAVYPAQRRLSSGICALFAADFRKHQNAMGIFRGEKFTKCSLHSILSGCIMMALYWMVYPDDDTPSLQIGGSE